MQKLYAMSLRVDTLKQSGMMTLIMPGLEALMRLIVETLFSKT